MKDDKEEIVMLSQEEIDKLLELIRMGKTLTEIGETLVGKPEPVIEKKIVEKILSPPNPEVSVVLEYKIDDKRVIHVGIKKPLASKDKDFLKAHEETYRELLVSLNRLVDLSR